MGHILHWHVPELIKIASGFLQCGFTIGLMPFSGPQPVEACGPQGAWKHFIALEGTASLLGTAPFKASSLHHTALTGPIGLTILEIDHVNRASLERALGPTQHGKLITLNIHLVVITAMLKQHTTSSRACDTEQSLHVFSFYLTLRKSMCGSFSSSIIVSTVVVSTYAGIHGQGELRCL